MKRIPHTTVLRLAASNVYRDGTQLDRDTKRLLVDVAVPLDLRGVYAALIASGITPDQILAAGITHMIRPQSTQEELSPDVPLLIPNRITWQ